MDDNKSKPELLDELLAVREQAARQERIRIEYEELCKKLQESEERFRILFDQAPEAIVLFDAEANRFVDANAKAELLFGCNRETLLASGPQQFYTEKQPDGKPLEVSIREYTERVREGERVVFERAIRNHEAKELLCEVQLVRFPSMGRNLVRAIFVDITGQKLAADALLRGEERLRRAQAIAHVGNWELDLRTLKMWASEEAFRIYGVDRISSEVPLDLVQGCVLPQYRMQLDLALQRLIKQEGAYDEEFRIKRQNDGELRFIHSRAELVLAGDGTPSLVAGALQDITGRKEAEKAMHTVITAVVGSTGQECLDRVTGNITDWLGADCVIIGEVMPDERKIKALSVRLDGEITTDGIRILEGPPFRYVARHGFRLFPEDVGRLFPRAEALRELNIEGFLGTPLQRPDGTVLGVLCALFRSPVKPVAALREIMDVLAAKAAVEIERMRAEEALQSSLREKEILLKEIHHRVKNNLQVMSSLLNMQSQYIHDPDDAASFRASMDRIKSMALIHDKLYRSDSMANIYLPDYVQDLSRGLLQSYALGKAIDLNMNVAPIVLDIDSAMHLGLIINELVSNSLKHAFPGAREGAITLDMREHKKEIEVVVSDDGIGFPHDVDFMHTPSLGMQLVVTLVEQLEGTISLSRDDGTEFRITFTRGS